MVAGLWLLSLIHLCVQAFSPSHTLALGLQAYFGFPVLTYASQASCWDAESVPVSRRYFIHLCKGHTHLKPKPPHTIIHQLPCSGTLTITKASGLFLHIQPPWPPSFWDTAVTLSSSYQYSVWLAAALPLLASKIQDLAKIPLLLTLAPLRTNLTSRLPTQEAFPGTSLTLTLQHPTKPQGLKCRERKGPHGYGAGQSYFHLRLSIAFCHILLALPWTWSS